MNVKRLFLLGLLLVLSAQCGNAALLFWDNFENGLGKWTGKSGGPHHGLDAYASEDYEAGKELTFTALATGGDLFSAEIFVSDYPIIIDFDYIGLSTEGSVAGDLGGSIGIADDLSGNNIRWLATTDEAAWPNAISLLDDEGWRHHSITVSNITKPSFRLVLQDALSSGGVAGDFFFDNIAVREQTHEVSFINTNKITIVDGDIAAPYPATLNVSGITEPVAGVQAKLFNFVHAYPRDVTVQLMSPNGTVVGLMGSTGARYSAHYFSLTFDDEAPESVSIFDNATTFVRPTMRAGANFSLPPGGLGVAGTSLLALTTNEVNGPWKLFVTDNDDAGDAGSIGSWALTFHLLPPPQLQVQRESNTFHLRWPTNATGYRLQSAAEMAPPVAWMNVTNSPALSGRAWTLTNQSSASAKFFRLVKP